MPIYELVHSGQKRAYGDSYKEYKVTATMPEDEVETWCNEQFGCNLSLSQWRAENIENSSMENHFRSHYTIKKTGNSQFLYTIIFPYCD